LSPSLSAVQVGLLAEVLLAVDAVPLGAHQLKDALLAWCVPRSLTVCPTWRIPNLPRIGKADTTHSARPRTEGRTLTM